MDKIWKHILQNSFWMVVFGTLFILVGVMIYKKRLMKQLPAWLIMLLCFTQCLGKGFIAILYSECYKVPDDSYRLIHIITWVGNITEIITTILILTLSIWNIRQLKMGRL